MGAKLRQWMGVLFKVYGKYIYKLLQLCTVIFRSPIEKFHNHIPMHPFVFWWQNSTNCMQAELNQ